MRSCSSIGISEALANFFISIVLNSDGDSATTSVSIWTAPTVSLSTASERDRLDTLDDARRRFKDIEFSEMNGI